MSGHVCGTGVWSGPLPGDPDTNAILTATPAFGGIDVTWTAAITNAHAVAHTYLYRSTTADFATSVRIALVGGTHFYDKLETQLTYYYWIQVVSINGTVGQVIGPAFAVPRLSIDATIEQLTGRIDSGVLAQSLKQDIDKIPLLNGDLLQEIQDRIAANELLGAAIQTAQTDASQAVSLINDEITQRTTAYNVLLQSLNTMAGQVNDNQAAIQNEAILRISNDQALAQQITDVQSSVGNDIAAVQTTLQTNINTVDGKVTDISALYTAKVQANGLIGGFGVYNDGTEVQAGFDVDTFWVGRTGPDKKKPFIIDSATGETYIDKAVIPTLTADMIDTRGLSIKDTNGNIILAAGTALDWSRIGGVNKPEDGATVGASLASSFSTWDLGGQSLVSVSDGKVGSSALRLSIGEAYPTQRTFVPIDPTKKYRVRFWARPSSNCDGVLYFSLRQAVNETETWGPVNGGRGPYKPSGQSRAAHNATYGIDAWGEYSYIWSAADWQTGVKFFRPEFLNNYNGTAGYWEVQGLVIEEATDVEAAKDAASAAQIAANTANNILADIASDNKLTPVEKQSAANEWGIINRERAAIQAQASALGISSELNDYNYTYAVLNDYITPLLADLQNPSAIDGPTFRDKWSYFYEYRQRLMNKMSAVAATKADWASVTGSGKPENGATVGADSSNLKSGLGVNMVFNGDYTDGLAGTVVGWRNGGNQHILSRNLSGYIVQGEGTAYIHQPGTPGAGVVFDANIWNGQQDQYFAVTPGKKYEISAWLNCHRCEGRMTVLFLDAAGTQLQHSTGNAVTHQSSITSIADMRQSWAIVTAPAAAVKAYLIVRGDNIGSYDPYVFFSRVYFGEAGAGQTEPSPWSPGRGISQITPSNVTTYIANAAIGAAQIGSINLVGTSNFAVKTAASGARMDMDSRRIKVFDANNVLRVQLGDLTV